MESGMSLPAEADRNLKDMIGFMKNSGVTKGFFTWIIHLVAEPFILASHSIVIWNYGMLNGVKK